MRADRGTGLTVLESREITIDAPTEEIPVGIDGDDRVMPTLFRCSIEPKALKVVLPEATAWPPARALGFRLGEASWLAFSVGETRSGTPRKGPRLRWSDAQRLVPVTSPAARLARRF